MWFWRLHRTESVIFASWFCWCRCLQCHTLFKQKCFPWHHLTNLTNCFWKCIKLRRCETRPRSSYWYVASMARHISKDTRFSYSALHWLASWYYGPYLLHIHLIGSVPTKCLSAPLHKHCRCQGCFLLLFLLFLFFWTRWNNWFVYSAPLQNL